MTRLRAPNVRGRFLSRTLSLTALVGAALAGVAPASAEPVGPMAGSWDLGHGMRVRSNAVTCGEGGRQTCWEWSYQGFRGASGQIFRYLATPSGRVFALGPREFRFTDDMGRSWTTPRLPPDTLLAAFSIGDDEHMALATRGGEVWTTTDGGGTWERAAQPPSLHAVDVELVGHALVRVDQDGGVWLSLSDHAHPAPVAQATQPGRAPQLVREGRRLTITRPGEVHLWTVIGTGEVLESDATPGS